MGRDIESDNPKHHLTSESNGIEDIEDIGFSAPEPRLANRLKLRVRQKSYRSDDEPLVNGLEGVKENIDCQSFQGIEKNDFVPQSYKIFCKTWGCAHNSSDSEYMAGLLSAYGFNLTDDKKDADLWLLNSCTVKAPAEQHFKNEIKEGQSLNKGLVLAGCVAQSAPRNDYIKGLSIVGVQQIDRIVEVVEETLKGNTVRILGQRKEKGKRLGGSALTLPKIRKNPLIEIIPISTGCLNQCTYCKTKHARGELASYPMDEIIKRAEQAFKEGVKEIWMTSEDTGAWGIDLGLSITDLLNEFVKIIPNDCMLRIGMTNPPYILSHLEAIAKIVAHPKVYSFLHVPIQSGSDPVLADMKREYCVDEFQKIVDFLREKVPGCTIATDIICGFPTETASDFQETMNVCKKNNFPTLFINQFYPRPGTPASKMKRVSTQEVKKRTKELAEYFQSYENYVKREGLIYDVLVTETSHDGEYYVGHNKFYEQILLQKNPSIMGKQVKVRIISSLKHSMKGVVITSNIYQFNFKVILVTVCLFLLFTFLDYCIEFR